MGAKKSTRDSFRPCKKVFSVMRSCFKPSSTGRRCLTKWLKFCSPPTRGKPKSFLSATLFAVVLPLASSVFLLIFLFVNPSMCIKQRLRKQYTCLVSKCRFREFWLGVWLEFSLTAASCWVAFFRGDRLRFLVSFVAGRISLSIISGFSSFCFDSLGGLRACFVDTVLFSQ